MIQPLRCCTVHLPITARNSRDSQRECMVVWSAIIPTMQRGAMIAEPLTALFVFVICFVFVLIVCSADSSEVVLSQNKLYLA